jgi:hypothetical protein
VETTKEEGKMENQVIDAVPQIHIRYDGRSIDIPLSEVDVGVLSTDEQIRAAVADNLGVPVGKLRAFAIDRNQETNHLTLRPEAVWG